MHATDQQSVIAGESVIHSHDAKQTWWPNQSTFGLLLLGLVFLLYVYVLLRTAWLCDDAHITLRTVDNFVNGYGLTWNTDERVQAYTHPLWMFLLSGIYWFTREVHYTVICLGMAVSLAAVVTFTRIARSIQQAIIGLLVLAFSKAFVDFSTSGLENPLTHLLIVAFFLVYFAEKEMTPRRLFCLSLLACLATLNRMDTLLIFAPALLQAFWTARRTAAVAQDSCLSLRSGRGSAPAPDSAAGHATRCFTLSPCRLVTLSAAAGFLPFLAWEVFSVIYYGFPFPNTAYAKLGTGLSSGVLAWQGLCYLYDSIANDPLTAATIAIALVAALVRPDRKRLAAAIGIALYLAYIVKVGGDFMSGRFLTAPFMAAACLLSDLPLRLSNMKWLSAALLAVCLGLRATYPSVLTDSTYGLSFCFDFEHTQIADERAYYYPSNGLLANTLGIRDATLSVVDTALKRRNQGSPVTGMGMIGMYGYYIGPKAHVIDIFALADPLLARLPTIQRPNWRIGHFVRHVPEGYIERLQYLRDKQARATATAPSTQPLIEEHFADPNLETFYDKLCLIVRGPLFSWPRWQAIWNMNLGRYDYLINQDFYRHPPERVWLGEVYGGPKPRGIRRDLPRDDAGNIFLPPAGFIVILPGSLHVPQLDLCIDGSSDYQIEYPYPGSRPIPQHIPAVSDQPGQVLRRIQVPPEVVAQGYDRFRIFPLNHDRQYTMRYVRPGA